MGAGLAYPNPISSYHGRVTNPYRYKDICPHRWTPKQSKGFSTPKNALVVRFLGTHAVDRYLRIMGENSTPRRPWMGQIPPCHGRAPNHRYLDMGFGHARGNWVGDIAEATLYIEEACGGVQRRLRLILLEESLPGDSDKPFGWAVVGLNLLTEGVENNNCPKGSWGDIIGFVCLWEGKAIG